MNTLFLVILTLFVRVAIPALEAATDDSLMPLSAEEVAGLKTYGYGPVALSPDGQWLAYTVQDTKREHARVREDSGCVRDYSCSGTDVWITNTKTGRARSLTEGKGSSWGPTWSPDGGKLAFFSNRDGRLRLWIWVRRINRLEYLSLKSVQAFAQWEPAIWLRDGSGLIVRVASKRRPQVAPKGTQRRPDSASNASRLLLARSPQGDEVLRQEPGTPLSDLAVVSVHGGGARRILEDVGTGAYKISPDGKRLAVASEGSRLANKFMWRWELASVLLKTGQKQILANDIEQEQPFGTWFSWSPDSTQLAYTDIGSQDYKNVGKKRAELYVVSLRDGSRWMSSGAKHPSFGDNRRPPFWSRDGNTIYLLADGALWKVGIPDGRMDEVARIEGKSIIEVVPSGADGTYSSDDDGKSMLVLTRDLTSMAEGFYRVVLNTGRSIMLHEANESFGYFPGDTTASSKDGTVISYLSERCDRYPNFWAANGTLHSPKQITHINPDLERRTLGESRAIEWQSPGGDVLHGALLLPADYTPEKRYPVIVDVYGGISPSVALNHFGIDVEMIPDGIGQFLATRGYAVFRPQSILHPGTPMRDIAAAVVSGVDKLIDLGLADAQRLGIMGHSYGGYSVAAVLVQSQRFTAAVMAAGHGNVISRCYRLNNQLDNESSNCEDGQQRIGATLWQDRERYISNSPIFFLDRVTTPLLIIQGARDENTPAYTAREVFAGLQRLGRTAEYVEYIEEGHSFTLYRDKVDILRKIDTWFRNHPLSTKHTSSGVANNRDVEMN